MRRLLADTLRIHDVDDVEGYCARVVERRLRRLRIVLLPDDRDDLLAYLIGVVWELSEDYDPSIGTFSGRLSRILPFRIIDWLRERFGDSRYQHVRELPGSDFADELEQTPDPLDLAEYVADRTSFPEWLDVARLSSQSQTTLREIVPRVVAGEPNWQIASAVLDRRGRRVVGRLLDRLRTELDEQRRAA